MLVVSQHHSLRQQLVVPRRLILLRLRQPRIRFDALLELTHLEMPITLIFQYQTVNPKLLTQRMAGNGAESVECLFRLLLHHGHNPLHEHPVHSQLFSLLDIEVNDPTDAVVRFVEVAPPYLYFYGLKEGFPDCVLVGVELQRLVEKYVRLVLVAPGGFQKPSTVQDATVSNSFS